MEPRNVKLSKNGIGPGIAPPRPTTFRQEKEEVTPLASPVDMTPRLNGSPRSSPHSPTMPELRFVVVGSKASGKSTFIQRALDLKKPASSILSCKKMSLEGRVFLINLVELQLDDIEVNENAVINWPLKPGKMEPLNVDGVVALYDVTRQESITRIPNLLSFAHFIPHIIDACSKAATPCVLVSCKCDAPISDRQIDPQEVEQLCMEETGIESIQTSVDAPETHKRCISVVLRNYIADSAGASSRYNGGIRPRAMTATTIGASVARPQGKRAKHGRATSELTTPLIRSMEMNPPDNPSMQDLQNPSTTTSTSIMDQARDSAQLILDKHQEQLDGDDKLCSRHNRPGGLNFQDLSVTLEDHHATAGTPTTIANSFLDFAAESDVREDPEIREAQAGETTGPNEQRSASGFTFEELVDKLLRSPMSKADVKFSAVFLCLYRKFAAPAELLSAILERFEALQKGPMPLLLKLGSQLRHLAIMAQWIAEYPGDFAHPFLRMQITEFIKHLANNSVFAAAANEINSHLETVVEDDDTHWACSDNKRGRTSVVKSFTRVPSMSETMLAILTQPDSNTDIWIMEPLSSRVDHDNRRVGHSKTPSTVSSLERTASVSGSTMSTPLNSVEAAQRQAEVLIPSSRIQLTKIQWHQFMELNEDDIARELTRIDWILYSSIRPRDLVRHVSLSAEQKERCQNLEHVNRMINQFNHVAFWAANMVLLRDKAKHRAKALEKFMTIAWKLRQLNNYNALGAIVAGLNGTAVHRLAQTRELVSPQAQKNFMRLEILMGTQKSQFAYRLAWENTMSERIPFLPFHRRDLVSAEEGNATFVKDSGERINWRKFEIMGEVILGIRESQGTPYPHIQRSLDVQRLVMDGRFYKDEDELYDRSISVEGPSANEPRRRFNWFQR